MQQYLTQLLQQLLIIWANGGVKTIKVTFPGLEHCIPPHLFHLLGQTSNLQAHDAVEEN